MEREGRPDFYIVSPVSQLGNDFSQKCSHHPKIDLFRIPGSYVLGYITVISIHLLMMVLHTKTYRQYNNQVTLYDQLNLQ